MMILPLAIGWRFHPPTEGGYAERKEFVDLDHDAGQRPSAFVALPGEVAVNSARQSGRMSLRLFKPLHNSQLATSEPFSESTVL